MNSKIVILDVCGTLYNSNTTMDFCKFSADSWIQKIFLHSLTSFPGKVINKISTKFFKFDLIRTAHIYVLKGVDRKRLDDLAVEFVSQFLEHRKIEEVHDLVCDIKDKEIVLVSASIEPVINAIASKLGIEKYLSSTLVYKKNVCCGVLKQDLLGKKHKYFSNENISLVITDNKSDYELCLLANKSIIVSKAKNIPFWAGSNLKIIKIIEV